MELLREAIEPKCPIVSRGVSEPVSLREHIVTCDFPGGSRPPPPPVPFSGSTHGVLHVLFQNH